MMTAWPFPALTNCETQGQQSRRHANDWSIAMLPWFVGMTGGRAALIEALLPEWPALDVSLRQHIQRDVIDFVSAEIALAPLHVRLGIGVFSAAFLVAAFVMSLGRGFARRPVPWRQGFLEAWSRINPQTRAVIHLFRSLTVLAYFEHPLVLHALDVEAGPDRQARFRAIRRDRLGAESQ